MRKLLKKLSNTIDIWLARRTKTYRELLNKEFGRIESEIKELNRLEIEKVEKEYNKLKLERLYIGGLQRDFSRVLTPTEVQRKAIACITFKENACDDIFNELLKEYSEALFKHGENEEFRNMAHNNINVVLKVEEKIKKYAHIEKPDDDFDANEPL